MAEFPLVANLLCLDLVNTEALRGGERVSLLGGFDDLVGWLRRAGALPEGQARAALERWEGTREGAAAYALALELRAALRGAAERLVGGRAAPPAAVELVNRVLAARPGYPQLVVQGRGYVTRFHPVADSAVQLLVPVAESAAWLLEHGDRSLLRRCENPRCILFFYDTTRNKRRRWCSMDACGSRAKAAAYYRRTRGG